MSNKKILIADDHYVVRAGITIMLETHFKDLEIEYADTYDEVKKKLTQTEYDLLILDIDMPGSIFKAMIKEIKNICEDIKILMFSGYPENVGLQYIKEGADGYLNKLYPEDIIIEAVHSIFKTGFYYPPKLINLLIRQTDVVSPVEALSERELQVFELLVEGNGNLEISNKLNLQMSTVSTYKKRIFDKLKVKNIAELIKIKNESH